MVDEILNGSIDPYGSEQIADLSTGALAELKRVVDAEVAKRLEDCKALMPQKQKRVRKKKP